MVPPNVAKVTRHGSKQPTHRIIHILAWHLVDKDSFAADMIEVTKGAPPTEQELAEWYDEHLAEVEAVQKQQRAALLALAKHHGLTQVHIEGLTESDKIALNASLSAIKEAAKDHAEFRRERKKWSVVGELDPQAKAVLDAMDDAASTPHMVCLRMGAATIL